MKTVGKHLGIWMLLLSCAAAQTKSASTTVQSVKVVRDQAGLRVEVTLSSPVQPSIETAVNPDRILVDFPGALATANTQEEVNTGGVSRVRTSQHSAVPPVTRVVLDLDQAHSYAMKAEGNRIIVKVGPALLSTNRSRSTAPASPVSLGLIGSLRRKPAAPQSPTADQSLSTPALSASGAGSIPASGGAAVLISAAAPTPPYSAMQPT